MAKYAARRIVGLVPTVLLLLFSVVLLVRLIPGDIVDLMLEANFGGRDDQSRRLLEHQLGLDQPLIVRYLHYVGGVLHGDFGHSLWTHQAVGSMILQRAGATIEIGIVAIIVGALFGVLVGTISAVYQDTPLDYISRSIAILGISVPTFAVATFVVVFPAIWWGWAPSLHYVGITEDPFANIKIILLPAIVLGLALSATIMRLMRTTMLDVLREDYIRTARAKGMRGEQVILRHAMKNALIPVVTLMGLQVAFLIGGSVIIEAVFAIPGVGRLLLSALGNRDYPIVQGVVVIVGFFVMVINLLIDLSYGWLDPRIRYS